MCEIMFNLVIRRNNMNKLKRTLVIASFAVLGSSNIWAESSSLFESRMKLAEQGDTTAQYNVGNMYAQGMFVKPDLNQAIKWLEKSAQNGHIEAQYTLATLYKSDAFQGSKLKDSFIWMQAAANNNHKSAQHYLGHFYETDKVVPINNQLAFQWFSKAANQGDSESKRHIGMMYYDGRGVDKDHKKAFEWVKKSASDHNYKAQLTLASMYQQGIGTNSSIKLAFDTLNQTDERNRDDKLLEAMSALAKIGSADAQNFMGDFAWNTYKSNYKSAITEDDNELRQIKMDSLQGIKNSALYWYEEAAQQKHPKAIASLSKINAEKAKLSREVEAIVQGLENSESK